MGLIPKSQAIADNTNKETMPTKPCKKAGCPELIQLKDKYCASHTHLTATSGKITDKRYSTHRWQRLRTLKGKIDPLCEKCLAVGITRMKDMIDHIIEVRDGGAFFDMDNLMSICNSCHGIKTEREKKRRGVK